MYENYTYAFLHIVTYLLFNAKHNAKHTRTNPNFISQLTELPRCKRLSPIFRGKIMLFASRRTNTPQGNVIYSEVHQDCSRERKKHKDKDEW